MAPRKYPLLTALVALFLSTGTGIGAEQNAQGAAAPSPSPDAGIASLGARLEPKAIDLLKAMSARLAGAKSMSFTALSTYESPSRYGPPLVYTTLSEVTLQRPDKLRIITSGDGPPSEFYYDGRTMTAYAPEEGFVAMAEAPPTIDATLNAAYDSAAIYFPFTDAMVADPYAEIADGLKVAFVIGQSKIVGGVTSDIIAIANDKVFVQLWIGAEDKLPRRIRAVYLDDPARLRHDVEFSNWKLDPTIPADAFSSDKASSAKRIPFARPEPPPPAGAKITTESNAAKPAK